MKYARTRLPRWESALLCAAMVTTLTAGCVEPAAEAPAAPLEVQTATLGAGNTRAVGETGRVSLSSTIDDGVSATVTLRNRYSNPVVVAFINTRNGGQSIQARLRSVSATSFEIFMQEPDNEGHNAETISYIVVERGRHVLDGGLIVEAGSVETATVHVGGGGFAGDAVSFGVGFDSTPAVLHSLNTHNNNDFMASFVTAVGVDGFEIGLEAAETGKAAASETIGWIAFSTGSGETNGAAFMTGAASDGSSDGVDNTAHTLSLSGFSAAPDLVASVYGVGGTDGSWARGAGAWSATRQAVFAEEDQVKDSERGHANETIAYAAFEADADLLLAGRGARWRIRNAAVPSSGQWAFRELMFCADADCATPLSGAAIDSGAAMSWAPAENAFDGDTSTMWKTTDAGAEGASWIGLELSEGAEVAGLYLKTDNVVYHSEDIYLEYYDADAAAWITTDVLTDLGAGSELTLSVNGARAYFLVDESVSAEEAEAYCASLGTTLATITRADDNLTVADLCEASSDVLCWIGLTDAATEGAPVWGDGAAPIYENWNTLGGGDNSGSSRDCVTMSSTDQTWTGYGAWAYGDCDSVDRAFVCDGPERGREYVAIDASVNHGDAQARCEALGDGYTLATITSEAENAIVAELCEGTSDVLCWIGLNDAAVEGSPEWEDGAPLLYAPWNTLGGGDNSGSSRDCATISSVTQTWTEYGAWAYADCDSVSRTVICSRPVFQ